MKKWLLWTALFLLMTVTLSFAETARKRFEQSYPLRYGSEISLSNTNGEVEIVSWEKEEVKIIAEIKVRGRSTREVDKFIKYVKIQVDTGESSLKIQSDYPERKDGSGFMDWIFGEHKPEVVIDYIITVPKKSDMTIKTVNGAIQVQQIVGKITLKSTNGQIDAQDLYGSVQAKTVNGSVEISVSEFSPDQSISINTVNGAIGLQLPTDVKADIEASCVNGSIDTDFPLTISGKFVGKNVQGKINGGGGLISLKTVNGSIQLFEK